MASPQFSQWLRTTKNLTPDFWGVGGEDSSTHTHSTPFFSKWPMGTVPALPLLYSKEAALLRPGFGTALRAGLLRAVRWSTYSADRPFHGHRSRTSLRAPSFAGMGIFPLIHTALCPGLDFSLCFPVPFHFLRRCGFCHWLHSPELNNTLDLTKAPFF